MIAIGMIINRSIYKNYPTGQRVNTDSGIYPTWKSPRDDANEYKNVILVN